MYNLKVVFGLCWFSYHKEWHDTYHYVLSCGLFSLCWNYAPKKEDVEWKLSNLPHIPKQKRLTADEARANLRKSLDECYVHNKKRHAYWKARVEYFK